MYLERLNEGIPKLIPASTESSCTLTKLAPRLTAHGLSDVWALATKMEAKLNIIMEYNFFIFEIFTNLINNCQIFKLKLNISPKLIHHRS